MHKNTAFDLQERTAAFAENAIDTLRKLERNPINKRLVEQTAGSSGSIGANYCEACESESDKDFIHKMRIATKEIKETQHWLRLLSRANPEQSDKLRMLWKEAQELLLIFVSSIRTKEKLKT